MVELIKVTILRNYYYCCQWEYRSNHQYTFLVLSRYLNMYLGMSSIQFYCVNTRKELVERRPGSWTCPVQLVWIAWSSGSWPITRLNRTTTLNPEMLLPDLDTLNLDKCMYWKGNYADADSICPMPYCIFFKFDHIKRDQNCSTRSLDSVWMEMTRIWATGTLR